MSTNYLWLLLVAFPALLAAEERKNERLAALGDNSWLYLDPQPSARLVLEERRADSPVRRITSKEPYFREYTSPAYGAGKLIYFGGGHSGYWGNDVEVYDPLENTWRQSYPPKCPPRDDSTYYSGDSERSYVDPATGEPQPYVLHGYARTGFDAGLGLYVSTTMFPAKTERDAKTKEWSLIDQTFGLAGFDAATNRWKLLATMPNELVSGQTGLSYDSDLKGLVGFSSGGVFLLKDEKWKRMGDANVPVAASGGAAAVYLPHVNSHLIAVLGHGGKEEQGQLTLYDMAKKQGRKVESLPEELRQRIGPGTGAYNLVMSYDEANERVVVMSASKERLPDVWTFDMASDRWEKLPAAVGAPKLFSDFEPGVGRAPLVYDPIHQVFLVVLRKNEFVETWAYRYRAKK